MKEKMLALLADMDEDEVAEVVAAIVSAEAEWGCDLKKEHLLALWALRREG